METIEHPDADISGARYEYFLYSRRFMQPRLFTDLVAAETAYESEQIAAQRDLIVQQMAMRGLVFDPPPP